MISSSVQRLLDLAAESHEAAKVMINGGFIRFSAAQTYYTMFYLVEALLLTKDLSFPAIRGLSPHTARNFQKLGCLTPNIITT